MSYFQSQGFTAQADIAAVVVVLGRITILSAEPPTTHTTKYDVDDSLTGKERQKAMKNAAKRARKAAKIT